MSAPRQPRGPPLRPLALACLLLCGSGCSVVMVRVAPRNDRCNTLLTPILDGAGFALFAAVAATSAGSSVRADCAPDDPDCYTTVANRQSDVRAYSSIAAIYAASAAWGVWARSQCRETLASLPPPVIPAVAKAEPVLPEPPPEPPPPPEPEPPGKRGRGYTSAWLGWGGGVVNAPGNVTGFGQYLITPLPLTLGLGLGAPVGTRLLLGAEWSVMLAFNCMAGMNSAAGDCDRTVVLQHVAATATWYPRWDGPTEVAPAGFFVRGGPALALLNSHYTNLADETPPTPAERARWKRTGGGVLVGAGLSLHLPRQVRTLDGGLDLAWHWYGASATEPESSFAALLRFGITFH